MMHDQKRRDWIYIVPCWSALPVFIDIYSWYRVMFTYCNQWLLTSWSRSSHPELLLIGILHLVWSDFRTVYSFGLTLAQWLVNIWDSGFPFTSVFLFVEFCEKLVLPPGGSEVTDEDGLASPLPGASWWLSLSPIEEAEWYCRTPQTDGDKLFFVTPSMPVTSQSLVPEVSCTLVLPF